MMQTIKKLVTFMAYMILANQYVLYAQTLLWKTSPIQPAMPPADTNGFVNIAGNARMYFAVFNQNGKLAHLIPHARLVIIPNVSHGGPVQYPVRFHKEVIVLLDHTR